VDASWEVADGGENRAPTIKKFKFEKCSYSKVEQILKFEHF
jgi:hypothetical protein